MAMSGYVGKDQQTSSTPPLGDTPSSHLPAFLEYGYSFLLFVSTVPKQQTKPHAKYAKNTDISCYHMPVVFAKYVRHAKGFFTDNTVILQPAVLMQLFHCSLPTTYCCTSVFHIK